MAQAHGRAPTGKVCFTERDSLNLPSISRKTKRQSVKIVFVGALTEIRTPVLAVKGPRPSPLDDEGGAS